MQIIEVASGDIIRSLSHPDTTNKPITCLAFRPQPKKEDETTLSFCSAFGQVFHYNYFTQKCLSVVEEGENAINCIRYNNKGDLYATAGSDGRVRVYLSASNALCFKSEPGSGGHTNYIYSIAFHPTDSNCCASSGSDRKIEIWDIKAGTAVKSILGPYVAGEALDFSADGTIIHAGNHSKENRIEAYNVHTGLKSESCHWIKSKMKMKLCPIISSLYKHVEIIDEDGKTAMREMMIACGGLGDGDSGEVKLFNLSSKKVCYYTF